MKRLQSSTHLWPMMEIKCRQLRCVLPVYDRAGAVIQPNDKKALRFCWGTELTFLTANLHFHGQWAPSLWQKKRAKPKRYLDDSDDIYSLHGIHQVRFPPRTGFERLPSCAQKPHLAKTTESEKAVNGHATMSPPGKGISRGDAVQHCS